MHVGTGARIRRNPLLARRPWEFGGRGRARFAIFGVNVRPMTMTRPCRNFADGGRSAVINGRSGQRQEVEGRRRKTGGASHAGKDEEAGSRATGQRLAVAAIRAAAAGRKAAGRKAAGRMTAGRKASRKRGVECAAGPADQALLRQAAVLTMLASCCANDVVCASSRASTITRSTGSVPEARISTRPVSPSFASIASRCAARRASACQS